MSNHSQRLKELRQALDLTQKELAEKLEMSWYQIKDIETGRVKMTATLAKLLYYEVGVNSTWLLTGEGDMLLTSKDKLPPSEDLDLRPEIREIIDELKQATNKVTSKITNLNKLIYTPPPQAAPAVREEKTHYITHKEKIPPPWADGIQAADDYESINYPLIDGAIACGAPSALADDQIIDWIPMPAKFNIKADFVMKTKGESMTEYGITSGMLCFIRKQPHVECGNIALLSVQETDTVQPVLKKVKALSDKIVFQNGRGEIMELNENISVVGTVTFWMPDIRGGGGRWHSGGRHWEEWECSK